MPDFSTTAMKAGTSAFGLSLASIALDGNALIGAFAGATLFVVSAQEYSLIIRLVYMLISLVMGYLAAPEITTHTPIQETAVAGFLAGVSCVLVGQKLQEYIRTLNVHKLLKRMRP